MVMGLIGRIAALTSACVLGSLGTLFMVEPNMMVNGKGPSSDATIKDIIIGTEESLKIAEKQMESDLQGNKTKRTMDEAPQWLAMTAGMFMIMMALMNLICVFNLDAVTGPYIRNLWMSMQLLVILVLLYMSITMAPDCESKSYKCVLEYKKLTDPSLTLLWITLVSSIIGSWAASNESAKMYAELNKPLLG